MAHCMPYHYSSSSSREANVEDDYFFYLEKKFCLESVVSGLRRMLVCHNPDDDHEFKKDENNFSAEIAPSLIVNLADWFGSQIIYEI